MRIKEEEDSTVHRQHHQHYQHVLHVPKGGGQAVDAIIIDLIIYWMVIF